MPPEAKSNIANVEGPFPQRGWSYVGSEQTSKLRKDNLKGNATWDELRDARVRIPRPLQRHQTRSEKHETGN